MQVDFAAREPERVAATNEPSELTALNAPTDSSDRIRSGSLGTLEDLQYEHITLTITFPDSNPATPTGAKPQAAKFNDFVGAGANGSRTLNTTAGPGACGGYLQNSSTSTPAAQAMLRG